MADNITIVNGCSLPAGPACPADCIYRKVVEGSNPICIQPDTADPKCFLHYILSKS